MIYTVLPWRPGRCWTCDLPSTAEGSWSSFWLALTGFVQQRWLAGLPLAPPPLSVRPVWLDEKHLSVITHHLGHSGLYFLFIQIYFYFILLYFYVTFSCSWIQLIKSEHLLLSPVLHRLRLLLLPISPLCRLLSNLEIKKQISKTFPSCESWIMDSIWWILSAEFEDQSLKDFQTCRFCLWVFFYSIFFSSTCLFFCDAWRIGTRGFLLLFFLTEININKLNK